MSSGFPAQPLTQLQAAGGDVVLPGPQAPQFRIDLLGLGVQRLRLDRRVGQLVLALREELLGGLARVTDLAPARCELLGCLDLAQPGCGEHLAEAVGSGQPLIAGL